MDKICSVCKRAVHSDEAAVLTLGGFGNAKYLCEECDADMDALTSSREPSEIRAADARIVKKLTRSGADDKYALSALGEILTSARERADKIERGTYDFSLDLQDDGDADIPEELKESDEDRAADEEEAKRGARIDRIMNVVCAVVFVAALGYVAYRIISYFL